jgi:hypothetical protein
VQDPAVGQCNLAVDFSGRGSTGQQDKRSQNEGDTHHVSAGRNPDFPGGNSGAAARRALFALSRPALSRKAWVLIALIP